MAAIVPKLLFLGNTQAGTVYTAPSTPEGYAIVKSINVCNTSNTNDAFSINLLVAGANVNISNAILGNIEMSAQNVFSYETSIVMPSGSSLYISQSSNNLTFTISGVEYVV